MLAEAGPDMLQERALAAQGSLWLIDPAACIAAEVEICRRPDGSLWQLGAGGFGRVYKAMRFGVQPVAVKVLAVSGRSGWQVSHMLLVPVEK